MKSGWTCGSRRASQLLQKVKTFNLKAHRVFLFRFNISQFHFLSLHSPGLLQCGHPLLRAGGGQTSNPGHRRPDHVPAFVLHPADSSCPKRQVSSHPAAGAALHVAARPGAAGALHPAALHGERSGADLHAAGSLREEILPGPDLLDRAAHYLPEPEQDGEEHGAGAALQQGDLQAT